MLRHSGLRFLLPYMVPYRGKLILGTIYAIIGASASAFSPTLLGRAIDALQQGIQQDVLALYALGLIGLSMLLAIFRYRLRMLTGDIAAGVSYKMSQDLFNSILLFDQRTMQDYEPGELLSRAANDFIYIWRFYSAGFQMAMHSLLLLLIGCTLMALTSPLMAIIVVSLLGLSIAIQMQLGRILEDSFTRVQQSIAQLSGFAQEHLSAIRMLSAYAQEAQVGAGFRHINNEYAQRNLDFVLRSSAISPLPSLVVSLSAAVIVFVGGGMIISDQITVGQYVQFIVYLGLLANAARQLSQAYERLQQGSAAAGRIGPVLRRRPQISDGSQELGRVDGNLRFEDVSVRTSGERSWALQNINLDIQAGTTLGIVGSTGSGKSTLLSLLGRLHDPDQGRVLLDEQDIRLFTLASLRRSISIVPQETLLFSMELRKNIALGSPDMPDERIQSAASAARLTNDLAMLPHGLETMVGERGTTLSGGQKQRTAIARALARESSILVLDDSLSSVDTETASQILNQLRHARTRRTCLIVSQRIGSVRDADQIVVLHEGQIVERGTHDELMAIDGRYAAMYRRELAQAEHLGG